MSGGSLDYICYKIDEVAGLIEKRGHTKFEELTKELLEVFIQVLHDLEWWYSGDYGESAFIATCVMKADDIERIGVKWKNEARRIIEIVMELTSEFKKGEIGGDKKSSPKSSPKN
ncbi:MAG: hypothetical protein ACXQT5_01790 [Candidatus Syntropharchaeia archaeon]